MLGVSGGIEPIFQISYTRKSETLNEDGDTYYEVFTPIAKEYMQKHNLETKEQLPDFFITSSNLHYKARIDFQAAWQTYVDAAISSTVNVPNHFSIAEVEDLYMYAWKQGLKGVTIYRDGCERTGILTTENTNTSSNTVSLDSLSIEDLQDLIYEKSQKAIMKNPNKCPMCGGDMFHSGGCTECQDCGYSPCSI
jgi:ribonucleoside-diphosphate reductase alpha chain